MATTTATHTSTTSTVRQMTPATHYTLTIELSRHISPDTRDGEPGEVVTLAELIAVNSETGERYIYIGPADCSTHGAALDAIAAIFNWERRTGRTFSPVGKPGLWVAERGPVEGGDPVEAVEIATTPSVWPKTLANVVEVVESAPVEVVPATQPVKAHKPRGRRVDAAKARRAGMECTGIRGGMS